MICPLLYLGNITRFSQKHDPAQCLQEDCAWWDENTESCCVLGLREALANVAGAVLVAAGHLPPPDQ